MKSSTPNIKISEHNQNLYSKECFLSSPNNKTELISLLPNSFKADSQDAFVCKGDADSKIASTALELAKENQVVVVADDTDVAVMQLCCYITGSRHFMPKSGHSNERVFCIRFDRALKMQFNEWSPQLPTTNRSQVMTVFLKPILHFSGQKKCINIRRFSVIFHHKTRIFSL